MSCRVLLYGSSTTSLLRKLFSRMVQNCRAENLSRFLRSSVPLVVRSFSALSPCRFRPTMLRLLWYTARASFKTTLSWRLKTVGSRP